MGHFYTTTKNINEDVYKTNKTTTKGYNLLLTCFKNKAIISEIC